MIQEDSEELSDIGIDLSLDLEDKNLNDREDDEFGNKNYLNVKQKDLLKISSNFDSINHSEKNSHKVPSESHLDRSFDQEKDRILGFNPDQRPPDLELAIKHAQARRVAQNKKLTINDSIKDNFCPCCGNQIENELLPIGVNREKLGFLGSGVPLYFEWMIFITILTFILGVLQIYSLVMNIQGNGCDVKNQCTQTFFIFDFEFNRIMSANRSNEYIDHTVSKINFLATMILILVTIIYQSIFKQIDRRMESRFITPSHFTIMVENIPQGVTNEQLKKFFYEVIQNDSIEIVKIVQGYEIKDLSAIQKLRASVIKKENSFFGREFKLKDQIEEKKKFALLTPEEQQEILKKKKKKKNETTLEEDLNELKEIENDKIEIRKKILRIDKKINEICKSYSTHLRNTGYAFVSFKNEENVQIVTDYFPTNDIERFFSYIFCQNNKSFMGSYIKVSKAPEPGDILWENLVYSKKERLKFRIKSLSKQFLSICIAFALIYCVKLIQTMIKDYYGESLLIEAIALSISVLTFIINTVISKLIKNLAASEKHPTYTKYLISVDQSLGMAQFINSILISVINDNIQNGRDLMTNGGVIMSIQYNVLVNTLFPLFNQYFNMWFVVRFIKRRIIKKQGDKCPITQYEAHKVFEGTTFNADKNYAISIRLMLINCFVGYLCPNIIFWNFLMIIADYWLEKYLLLRRHASPPAISGELFFANIKYFNDLYILIFAIGCCYWQYMIYGSIDDWTQIQIQFSVFYYVLPIQKIINLCTQNQANPNTHKTYQNVSQYFFNDYDRANPATASQAQQQYMQNMQTFLKSNQTDPEAIKINSSLLKSSFMQAVPIKLIPESENFPFLQNRNINPLFNQPINFQLLQQDGKSNRKLTFLPNLNAMPMLKQQFSHKPQTNQEHHDHIDQQEIEINPNQQNEFDMRKMNRYFTQQHSNQYQINIFQINNNDAAARVNQTPKSKFQNQDNKNTAFTQQGNTSIRNNILDSKDRENILVTDQILIEKSNLQ
ncbi:transmembrane protein, putative (macronuclear) [Tetrahymena thermophila SB210]|uniref:Transmembrane protein, putative n=1 Tax=Tetrahymena thermophila (strain SB210) TaxID=312017 RepID=I7MKN9_TETTS|nr:transmembrane protein, putative [Tetrahymena thermophila SB210]EAR99642.2 transmembrane protein, putative [Tetrahymena thermophila SB210]|eukprot:XP_001019887.2 transmembrane protein, putative [Tetrahymena thermophila SB210]